MHIKQMCADFVSKESLLRRMSERAASFPIPRSDVAGAIIASTVPCSCGGRSGASQLDRTGEATNGPGEGRAPGAVRPLAEEGGLKIQSRAVVALQHEID